jgi:hypothetical protein
MHRPSRRQAAQPSPSFPPFRAPQTTTAPSLTSTPPTTWTPTPPTASSMPAPPRSLDACRARSQDTPASTSARLRLPAGTSRSRRALGWSSLTPFATSTRLMAQTLTCPAMRASTCTASEQSVRPTTRAATAASSAPGAATQQAARRCALRAPSTTTRFVVQWAGGRGRGIGVCADQGKAASRLEVVQPSSCEG